ncbi:AI-2E family transporter [Konateibacter massiliensis]|uniref:AI-2E family transporter n=1 Tax=Konateibacter massiliensis TaxID=2002841 RepID=UPI000C154576|nr:AI-2E family transporter [Konateibacter massiliensis]
MNKLNDFMNNSLVKRILSILLVVAIIYVFRGMLNLLLLIFIVTFILGQLQKFIFDRLNKRIKVSRKLITIIMYVVLVAIFTLFGVIYIPRVTQQLIDIITLVSNFNVDQIRDKFDSGILNMVFNMVSGEQIDEYIKLAETNLLQFATTVGTFSVNFVISLLISFLFLLERDEILAFVKHMENSKVSFIYENLTYYGEKFLNTFGKVIELQIVIALINSVLSILILSIMGFPQTLGLGAMIFILGLIPVAGVIISLIPLTIIAFNIGGIIKIIEVVVMIVVLHSLEAYVLNPKLMSVRTKLPVFLVFLILIVSEHYMGIWGLLFGIPLFMFFLDLLDIQVMKK